MASMTTAAAAQTEFVDPETNFPSVGSPKTALEVNGLPLARPSTNKQWEVGSGRQLLTARLPKVHRVEAGEAAVVDPKTNELLLT